MQMSARGLAMLEQEEGVVLKAYRDVVGVWTIGAGLTAASGVVKPKAGMQISREEASALLIQALRRSYEPTVETAMSIPGARVIRPTQPAFDAGVSFHWNTGAIGRASWVKAWKAGSHRSVILNHLLAWCKGGGKVLPGLKARRMREADLLLDGRYPAAPRSMGGLYATLSLRLDADEFARVRSSFAKLGYVPGSDTAQILQTSVIKFQADHGLTADGIIGRATLSTLQRRLDAPRKAAAPAIAAPVAAAGPSSIAADQIGGVAIPPMLDWVILGLAAAWSLSVAWSYRDVIAAKINSPLPRLAAKLRSF